MTWSPVPGLRVIAYGKALLVAAAVGLLCAVLGAVAGGWAGIEWQRGRQARVEADALRDQAKETAAALRDAQGAAAQISRDMKAATAAIHAQSKGYADDLERNRVAAAQAGELLRAALARRPDLAGLRMGPEFLRAWNAANRGGADPGGGAGAAGADGADQPGPQGPVPEPAAGGGRRPGHAGAEPLGGDSAVRQLRRGKVQAGQRGGCARPPGGRADRACAARTGPAA